MGSKTQVLTASVVQVILRCQELVIRASPLRAVSIQSQPAYRGGSSYARFVA
jgi:hypothetical protein